MKTKFLFIELGSAAYDICLTSLSAASIQRGTNETLNDICDSECIKKIRTAKHPNIYGKQHCINNYGPYLFNLELFFMRFKQYLPDDFEKYGQF